MGLTHFDENGKAVMVDVTDKKRDGTRGCGRREDSCKPGCFSGCESRDSR